MTALLTAPRRSPALPQLVLGLVVLAALVVRWQVVDVQSGDYRAFLLPWYQQLATGGFGALAGSFSNYNTPYLVLLWLLTQVPVDPLVAVKGLSVVFDLLLAFFVHRIVAGVRPGVSSTVVTTGKRRPQRFSTRRRRRAGALPPAPGRAAR